MLKGRYYHDGDFMHSTRRKRASHTWRAILAGREVLERGLIRRIGNGKQTNIWRDRWIPAHFDARPITPGDGQALTMVSELMTESGVWNDVLIREVFLPIDARAILKIPIRQQDEDWWAWELEKHGNYSVKSAYRKLYAMNGRGDEEMPSGSGDDSWKKIWEL